MILIIDNYDSFTFNLVQLLEEFGEECLVRRNDQITMEEVERLLPSYIVISPGPGVPEGAGVTMELIEKFGNRIPTLGVCLGHQAIAKVYGGEIKQSAELYHGKASNVIHNKSPIFSEVPELFSAGRYHSWEVDRKSLPNSLAVTAETEFGEVMAIKHQSFPVEGVQFHPESILTTHGRKIIANFLETYKASVI